MLFIDIIIYLLYPVVFLEEGSKHFINGCEYVYTYLFIIFVCVFFFLGRKNVQSKFFFISSLVKIFVLIAHYNMSEN